MWFRWLLCVSSAFLFLERHKEAASEAGFDIGVLLR